MWARVGERVVVARADARVAAATEVAGPVTEKAEGAKDAEAAEAMEVAETVGAAEATEAMEVAETVGAAEAAEATEEGATEATTSAPGRRSQRSRCPNVAFVAGAAVNAVGAQLCILEDLEHQLAQLVRRRVEAVRVAAATAAVVATAVARAAAVRAVVKAGADLVVARAAA